MNVASSRSGSRILGAVLVVAGVLGGAGLIGLAIHNSATRVSNLVSMPVEGGVVPESVSGDVTVFASVDHVVGKGSARPAGSIRVFTESNKAIEVRGYGGTSTFNQGGKSAIAMWTVAIPAGQQVFLAATGTDASIKGWLIGDSPTAAGSFVLPLVFGIVIAVLGLVFGILLMARVLPRRR